MSTPALFTPFRLRGVEFPNRIGVSPMCQYSAENGFVNDWHVAHIGSRAAAQPGLIIVEATAIVPEGRITPGCTGLWSDDHIEGMARLAKIIRSHGSVPGIQIGHAGRKASARLPWLGGAPLSVEEGAWQTVAPSAIPFDTGWPTPRELTIDEVRAIPATFAAAARRALAAGFEMLEIHGAHGYLMNEFLSPLMNHRTDEYGGSFENRTRLLSEVITAIRRVWPEHLPLFLRISASDWAEGGWTLEDSVALAKLAGPLGVDLIDCSSGGGVPNAKIALGPGYQVPFAEAIRSEGRIATAAVGLITDAAQANTIVESGQADMVLLAREFLRNPYWPIQAARALGAKPHIPNQYLRAI